MPAIRPSRQNVALREEEVIEILNLQPGHTVAEIGPPHFAEALARAVGRNGRVHSVATAPDGCCDRVLMANVWGDLADAREALAEAARVLRPGGRLIIIDKSAHFPQLLHALERNWWDVHRHGDAASGHCFIEAAVSDPSVLS